MEASDKGPTRGTSFVARCSELIVVTGLLWHSLCVFDGAGFFRVIYFDFSFFERTRPCARKRPPCLIYLSTSSDAVFCV